MIVKWANRFVMNDKFTYTDFLESIEGNVEDGLWAIELVKLLKSYDFRCVYCTTNVSPSKRQYDYLDFYRCSTIDDDIQRIQRLFQTISNESIHIFDAQVTITTIADFLQFNPNTVVLLLVDFSLLYPARSCCTFRDYCGHYIILIGYSQNRKSFKVVDPTRYFRSFEGPL
ncbi:uncharacterized protein [Blastocystis hominis]|uniref:Uncharacterized protein n=1 Tax=Blastocystis hominis TaxID=12968 RepID=D8LYK0_BLAHO|nr:uncharacterized protein [Blastocystis hominis]CBK20655.2 unnamed protein product [Blastocystis hominis]|eukprot:XP_012894703.1 uncharacterized protein [Blastocystis hominis]